MKSPDAMTREELEDEVVYLRGELGLTTSASAIGAVKAATGLSDGPARVLLALYRTKGRALAKHQILDTVPAQRTIDDRDPKLADVWICRIRQATCFEAVDTVWGQGYAISPTGRAIVEKALEGAAA